jgi:transposase
VGRKQLSDDVKSKIIEKYHADCSVRNISQQLNVPRSTVHDIITKFRKDGSKTNLPRTERPAKVDIRTNRKVVKQTLVNPRITHKAIKDELQESSVNVSLSTVSSILHKTG